MERSVLVMGGFDSTLSFAKRVEDHGYNRLWIGELWGRDAVVALTEAALATEDLSFGTAILNVYGRTPATLAQSAASLADVADDLRLGLGTSTRKAIEDLHGVPFENPPRRLHETVALVKRFLAADGRVHYDGEMFQVDDFPALDADVPVFTAALGPANRRATGRTADGWLPHNIPFAHLEEAFETIARSAEEVGRDPSSITVSPYVPAAVSEDPDEAVARIQAHLAYYVGSGGGYKRAVAEHFPAAAERVATAWQAGDRATARSEVTREMVDALGIGGTADAVKEQLATIESMDVIDETIVVVPGGTDRDITRTTLSALAPK